MVAKITTPKNIAAALNYNEKKVQKGAAQCLHAVNYLNDAHKMNFYQKLNGFERLNILNERAATKTLHVSLNFDPSEKLDNNKLIEIASLYMNKIGFGEQPFLIYRHEDAGHPHIHIVSTTIKDNGSRINTHNIGKNQSEKARKEIEGEYSLIRAERQPLNKPGIKPVNIEKAIYGAHETKRAISNVISAVFSQYKFTSLPELNAALRQFNVVADRGKEDGRIYKNRGLLYRILDAEGNKAGVPIKASSISCKPTLDNIEKKFASNNSLKEPLKQRLKNSLEDCLQAAPGSINNLMNVLEQKNIYVLLRQNAEGRLYGVTFVDNETKCVFNGSDLGREYSAAALQSRLAAYSEKPLTQEEINNKNSSDSLPKEMSYDTHHEKIITPIVKSEGLLDILLSGKEQYDNTPSGLLKKRKKKKKKNQDF